MRETLLEHLRSSLKRNRALAVSFKPQGYKEYFSSSPKVKKKNLASHILPGFGSNNY
jgi:hypothetical protein